jgi:hypothetical protein
MKNIGILHLYTRFFVLCRRPILFSIFTRKVSPLLMKPLPSRRLSLVSLCIALSITLATFAVTDAANPATVQIFYLPLPEDQGITPLSGRGWGI